jgi:UDP-glucuronate 4-epimerase
MAVYNFLANISAGRPITMYGDGTMRRDYTYVDDIVEGICLCVYKPNHEGHTVYNLGNSNPYSLLELIGLCEETTGKRADIVRTDVPVGDVPITYADIEKARIELGVAPKISLRDGLERMFRSSQR